MCRKKSGGCCQLASGYAGHVVFVSQANRRFSTFIHNFFCHAVAVIRDLLIMRTHSLCTACGVMPSRTRVHQLPQRPHLLGAHRLLCNSRSYNSRTLAGCGVMCGMDSARDCCSTSCKFRQYFSFILHVNIYTHFHSRIPPCT